MRILRESGHDLVDTDARDALLGDVARRILVIEDELDLLFPIAELLKDEGYEVLAASDGAEAMRYLREEKPDLVILDLSMPRMSGWEFSGFKRDDPQIADIPVILLSGNRDIEKHAQELGAVAWLAKPLQGAALVETVKRCLP
jgi:CheY-like chemotaxis protein